ncbi:unnamed protein product [Psylliodes chrysocephalus]|uniref:C2H2-type domain-containing protein n=1 Tax=Psylliodes chrysocephalus TaxID=3402493 RepID=A0A9P0CTE1_9CUCU|nr:unnamed protein product [Psylliodes chrysocephala]
MNNFLNLIKSIETVFQQEEEKEARIEVQRIYPLITEKFECPMCGKYYTTKKSLKTHLTIDCQNQEQFHCPFCPQKLKHKRSMMRHINNVHSKQKNVTSDSM